MALLVLSEPAAATEQSEIYNQNVGGTLNRRNTYSVPAGTNWAVIGCVIADAATQSDVTDTIIPAIAALSEVTSVNGDQFYGQVPATIEDAGREGVVYVTARLAMTIGSANTFNRVEQNSETIKPPTGKKWFVAVIVTPSALDASAITTLETAVEGITGVTTCKHLVDGTVSSRAAAAATAVVTCHLRLDTIVA